jgi:hypothetical protein
MGMVRFAEVGLDGVKSPANVRPAPLEKVQLHEKTHLSSHLGDGIQRTGC